MLEDSIRSNARARLVVVGNGMAGMRTVEELLKIAPQMYSITVFGAEPHPNYNRSLLSPVLAGEQQVEQIIINSLDWYAETASCCIRASALCASTAPADTSRPATDDRGLRPPVAGGRFRSIHAAGQTVPICRR